MRMRRTFVVVVALALLVASFNTVQAGKKDKPKVDSEPANVVDLKMNLVPFLKGAIVVGDAADLITQYGGENMDKVIYGFGVSVAYYPTPRYGIQAKIERAYKTLPGINVGNGNGWLYSIGGILNFRTLAKSTPYARCEVGRLTAKVPMVGEDLGLGTYSFARIGLGLFAYTSKSVNMRYELYYTYAFSKGREIDLFGGYEIDFSGQWIGIEFGVGIPIMKR